MAEQVSDLDDIEHNESEFHVIPDAGDGHPAIIEVTVSEQLDLARAELKVARQQLEGDVDRIAALESAVNAALGYISADIDSDDEGNAYRLCAELRSILEGQ